MKYTKFGMAVASFALLAGAAFAQADEVSLSSISSDLGVGSQGEEVATLQVFLSNKGYLTLPNGAATGYFGNATKAGLMKYQASLGVNSTGYFGPMTRAKAGGKSMMSDSGSGSMMASDSVPKKSADLRVLLNALEREHVSLAANATRRGFDGAADFSNAAASLDKNSVEISGAIASVYGADAGTKFLAIWRSHIGFFVDYTVAAKKGDQAGMAKAVANLGGYVDAISDFLSGANPNLPRAAVYQLVSQHVTLLKAAVDNYGAAKYDDSYTSEHSAYNQIGTIADALSGAIVKQYPEKF